jgi:hypothetical protein
MKKEYNGYSIELYDNNKAKCARNKFQESISSAKSELRLFEQELIMLLSHC